MKNKQIFKVVGRFWQSKNTISSLYTIPNCTEEQKYIICLLSRILGNCSFHWQLSILVSKIPLLSRNLIQIWKFLANSSSPCIPPCYEPEDWVKSNRLSTCIESTSMMSRNNFNLYRIYLYRNDRKPFITILRKMKWYMKYGILNCECEIK